MVDLTLGAVNQKVEDLGGLMTEELNALRNLILPDVVALAAYEGARTRILLQDNRSFKLDRAATGTANMITDVAAQGGGWWRLTDIPVVTADLLGDNPTATLQSVINNTLATSVELSGFIGSLGVIKPKGKTIYLRPNATIKARALTNAEKVGATEYGLFNMTLGGRIIGTGTIDGNKAVRAGEHMHGIYWENSTATVAVQGPTVTGFAGDAIRFQNTTAPGIKDVTITGNDKRGIHIIDTNDADIDSCRVDGGTHGIQWWAGITRYSENLKITNCQVKNVSDGGIWGYRGLGVTVTGGSAVNCGDYCYGFEGCKSSTITGVYARNGKNAGLAFYNGCENVTYSDCQVVQGVGMGPGVKSFAPNRPVEENVGKNRNIVVRGGSITCNDLITPVNTDQGCTEDFRLEGVSLTGAYVQFLDVNFVKMTGCTVYTNSTYGIYQLGGSNGVFKHNRLFYTGNADNAANEFCAAYRSPEYSASNNVWENNEAYGFGGGCFDDFQNSPLATSGNKFINNITSAPVKQNKPGYSLICKGNYKVDGKSVDPWEPTPEREVPLKSMNDARALSLSDSFFAKNPGRQGVFMLDAADQVTPDDGAMTIVSGGKRFKRQYQHYVEVDWFGAKGGANDDTLAFQTCMDWIWKKGGGTMYMPFRADGYSLSKLALRSRVNIKGGGDELKIKALPSAEKGFFVLGDTPVAWVTYENFELVGNLANLNQNGFDFTAYPQEIPAWTGGIWWAKFKKLKVSGFPKNQFHFYAVDIERPAYNAGDVANQFLTFEDVQAYRVDNDDSLCLYAEGQFGQVQFLGNCQFDGPNLDKGTLIKLISHPHDNANGSDNVYTINFMGTTMQGAKLGVYTYNVSGVCFYNCHHEALRGVYHIDAASQVTIDGATQAGGCGVDGGAGFFLKNSVSHVTFRNVPVGGEDTTVINQNGTTISDGWYAAGPVKFTGTTRQIQVVNGTLYSANETKILLDTANVPDVVFSSISGGLGPDALLTCRVWGSGSFKIMTGGNISLPNWMNGVLYAKMNDVLVFKHMDLPDAWVLVSATSADQSANLVTNAGLPTTADVAPGKAILWKDTSDGSVKWYLNDGGIIKAGAAFA
ncbi:right-handed parallel beta-helix repeat-containing protein [Spirosoma pomorum]